MKIEPYLFFDGQAEEAIAFYQEALGAKLEALMRYAECPDPVPPEYMPAGGPQKLMHASLLIDGQRLMLSDGVPPEVRGFYGFSLTLQYESEPEVRRAYDKLAEGGQIIMPLGATFFSPCYGMLNDRFGVQWMVMILSEAQAEACRES
ncbi:VOC family protein [Chitiniphilus purpureus]|uniref:VOC family protein n=1 Tax=Chitiniphilus purpureus TaxID=2981137 RepID=A0ABY6DK13_9NEIS|nr:VOC family protein [Chitiniphilus sp. CD1]UXY14700.1 VOC family protein [Chitiniphilus sp. CD1]